MKAFEIKNRWIKYLLRYTHLYDIYKEAENAFVEPRIICKIGKWSNDPCLPVWRKGPTLFLTKSRNVCHNTGCYGTYLKKYIEQSKAYRVCDSVDYISEYKDFKWNDKTYKSQVMGSSKHKLPGRLKSGQYVWNRKIRKKLHRWYLDWIPVMIQFPEWMSFQKFNYDIMWKTKYDDYRYEFPGHFTIVAFGLSISFWQKAPLVDNVYSDVLEDDCYWEGILNYIYKYNKSIKKTIDSCSWWTSKSKDDDVEINKISIRPEFLKNPTIFYNYLEDVKKKYPEKYFI